MAIGKSVIAQVSDELGAHVYMLVDPRPGVPFYVGKGQGLRHTAHLAEALGSGEGPPGEEPPQERSRKVTRIREILNRGDQPEVWILRYGLTPTEYTAVEAAAIDLLMTFPVRPRHDGEALLPLRHQEQLANGRRESVHGHGMVLLQTLIDDCAAPELATSQPLLLITLNGWQDLPGGELIARNRIRYGAGWKREWLVPSVREKAYDQIGESASAWWSVSPQAVTARGIEHVAVLHRGVTRAVFKIDPGSWGDANHGGRQERKADPEVSLLVSGHQRRIAIRRDRRPARTPDSRTGKGAQNPISYWPRPIAAQGMSRGHPTSQDGEARDACPS